MVFKAVSALETTGRPGPLMAVGRWFSRALRYGVTANPLFAVRNLIRDTENSIAVSQISGNPFKNLADGFAQIDVGQRLKNLARAMAGHELEAGGGLEPEAISAMAGGALMRLASATDAGVARASILDTPGKLSAFGRYLSDVAGAYKEVLASGEDVNRLALYTQLREQGAPHDFAAFSARDLQDFTLKGAPPSCGPSPTSRPSWARGCRASTSWVARRPMRPECCLGGGRKDCPQPRHPRRRRDGGHVVGRARARRDLCRR
jgi:hypothetical protein